jgi:hypothetical protein
MVGQKSTRSPKKTRRSPRRRSIGSIEAPRLLRVLGLVDLVRLIKSASEESGQRVQSQAKVMKNLKRSINVNLEVALEIKLLLLIINTKLTADRNVGMILVIAEDTIQEIADVKAQGIVIDIGLIQKTGGQKMVADMTLKETG